MIDLHYPTDKKWNKILIIGERPNKDDLKSKKPFMSSYGVELAKLCMKAGFYLSSCATVYAYRDFPPQNDIKKVFVTKAVYNKDKENHREVNGSYITKEFFEDIIKLHHDIKKVKPLMIIPLGEAALFALLTVRGIDAYRGSMLYWESEQEGLKIKVLPTHSPARMFKQWQLQYLMKHDLKRAFNHVHKKWPHTKENFIIRPTFEKAIEVLDFLMEKAEAGAHIAVDIETRLHRFISCIGFAWSREDAICIPLINSLDNYDDYKEGDKGFYWTVEEEVELVTRIKALLECKTVRVSGQNYHYDAQYLAFHWGVRSHIWRDSMVMHHTFFSADMPKDLNLLSSLYCEGHVYWKDEGKGHEPTEEGEESYWIYNCKDCCRTFEAVETMEKAIPAFEMEEPIKFQHRMWQHLLITMCRGVRYANKNRGEQKAAVTKRMRALQIFMESLVPPSVLPRGKTAFYGSPKQLGDLFYKALAIKPVTKRDKVTGIWKPTVDDEALKTLAKREPIIKPLCEAIRAYRSLAVYNSTFLTPNPDVTDGRMRSGYKLSHPSTYRLASAGDVFDYGLNLQNLPKGNE